MFLLASNVTIVVVAGTVSADGEARAFLVGIGAIGSLATAMLFNGVCGCLLASAFHPKLANSLLLPSIVTTGSNL